MKKRQGFVSNSSSSSFVINRYYLSDAQIDKIKEHGIINELDQEAEARGEYSFSDEWTITINEKTVKGSTYMDNFDMYEFLTEEVGVPKDRITWDD